VRGGVRVPSGSGKVAPHLCIALQILSDFLILSDEVFKKKCNFLEVLGFFLGAAFGGQAWSKQQGERPLYVWRAVAPEGYVALGMVATATPAQAAAPPPPTADPRGQRGMAHRWAIPRCPRHGACGPAGWGRVSFRCRVNF